MRPLRVLVVDDCRDTTDSTAELVREWGHDARRAYAGAAALALAAEYRPDAMLVDLAMRGVDGCEVASRIRRTPGLDGTLLIAVTGYADASLRRRAADAGFDFYALKPMDPTTLESLLMSRQIELSAAAATIPPADRSEQDPQVRCWFMNDGLGEHTADGLRGLGTGEVLPFSMAEAGPALRDEIARREVEEAAQDDHWRDDGGQGQRPAQ